MICFKFISPIFFRSLVLFFLFVVAHSCFPPNGMFDKYKQAQCVFFIPKTMQILKTCNDDKFNFISALQIDVKYDTIKIINGKPSNSFTLFKSSEKIDFPYNLDTIVKDRSKEISVGLKTDKREYSYSLVIQPRDWIKDTLIFVFYYRG